MRLLISGPPGDALYGNEVLLELHKFYAECWARDNPEDWPRIVPAGLTCVRMAGSVYQMLGECVGRVWDQCPPPLRHRGATLSALRVSQRSWCYADSINVYICTADANGKLGVQIPVRAVVSWAILTSGLLLLRT